MARNEAVDPVMTDVFVSSIVLENEVRKLVGNPRIPLPFRIQTSSLKVLDLEFKVLDGIIQRYKPEKSSLNNNNQAQ
jgi:hypothetical protein